MIARVKRAVAGGLYHSRVLGRLERRHREKRALVLTYHRINDAQDPFFPALDTRSFEAQLDHLSRTYRVDPLSRVLEWMRDGEPGPPRAAITIDDGYADTHEIALPRLRARGLGATLFLSTQPPEAGQPLWLDRLRLLFKHTAEIASESSHLGPGRHPLTTVGERLAALSRVAGRLKRADASEVEDAVGELWQVLGGNAIPEKPRPLTWSRVRELAESGVEIGAHTHRHYVLANLRRAEAREEIERSLALIRQRLGRAAVGFAYPNGAPGDYGPGTLQVLIELGVAWACTTRPGFVTPASAPFELPRLHTSMDTLPLFACRLAGLSRETDSAAPRVG